MTKSINIKQTLKFELILSKNDEELIFKSKRSLNSSEFQSNKKYFFLHFDA